MVTRLPVEDFLKRLREEKPLLLDARSPAEYQQAHIPGAVSFPLLNDEHRKEVGITYKQRGKEAAVIKGFELVGGKFAGFAKDAKSLLKEHAKLRTLDTEYRTPITEYPPIFLYCWRGGMRSNIMAWVLGTAGFEIILLEEGYKVYRHRMLEVLQRTHRMVILGGKTGSGKTEMLAHLRHAGEQTICLETLAHHRGSAFGALGMQPQPRNEQFENLLAEEWEKLDEGRTVWLENESQSIGSVVLPKHFFERMRRAPVVEMVLDKPARIQRILAEYGNFPVQDLIDNTKKIEQRLGGLRTQTAVEALQEDNYTLWVDEILYYYDKAYQHGIDSRAKDSVVQVEIDEKDFTEAHARKLIDAARTMDDRPLTMVKTNE